MVFDAHAHWLPEEIISNAHFFSKAWEDIEAHVAMMQQHGVERAVLTNPTSDAHLKLGGLAKVAKVYNDNVAQILLRYPGRFVGAAALPSGNGQKMLDELKRSTEELGFTAVSLASSYDGMYLDDAMFLPVYAHAQAQGLPIFVHSQIVNPIGFERVNDPLLTPVIEYVFDMTMCIGKLLMAGVFAQYPKVKFIFANFGGAIPFLQHRFDATYQMLRGINFVKDLGSSPTQCLKNIFVDTGGDKTAANFLLALEFLGPKNILWGSDWPGKKDISTSLQAVKDLPLSEEDKNNILGKNLERLLKGAG